MLNIILFGAPGAGKGTQAKRLSKEFGLLHFSTGEIIRQEIADNTELGRMAKDLMDKGLLLPDDIIIDMVEDAIKSNNDCKGFIFDGFPRTTVQAEAFEKMLVDLNMDLKSVVMLCVEKEILLERLHKRAKLENRSDDNSLKIIENRINQYKEKTIPIKDFYDERNKLAVVNGDGEVDNIYKKIVDIITK